MHILRKDPSVLVKLISLHNVEKLEKMTENVLAYFSSEQLEDVIQCFNVFQS